MTVRIRLPGRAEPLEVPEPGWAATHPPPTSRRVYAAAHVAARPAHGPVPVRRTKGSRTAPRGTAPAGSTHAPPPGSTPPTNTSRAAAPTAGDRSDGGRSAAHRPPTGTTGDRGEREVGRDA